MDKAKPIFRLNDIELAQDHLNFIVSYTKEGKKRHAEFYRYLDEAMVGLSRLMVKRKLAQRQIGAVEELAALVRSVEAALQREVLDRLRWDELGRLPSRSTGLSRG